MFDMSIRSGYICDENRKLSKNSEILHVFGPHFFGGGGSVPPILDLHYKIEPDSDHVAKFDGDQSRDLGRTCGERKKKHHR